MRRSVLSTLLIGSAVALLISGRDKHGNHTMAKMMNGDQPRWLRHLFRNLTILRVASMAYGRGLIRRLAR
jgi:hypothetical protein